jgi:hypothetical protein
MRNENAKKKQPVKEFKAGTICAAIWTDTANINGRPVPQHSIRIQKRYRDERTGEWKSTTYYRPEDMPRLALVASKVFECLTLREIGDASEQSKSSG